MPRKNQYKASEVLQKARDYLAEPGHWYKGGYCNPDDETQMCGFGACNFAATGTPKPTMEQGLSFFDTGDALHKALNKLYPHSESPFRYHYYSIWQDEPERTLDEVLAVFDEAIKQARIKEDWTVV